MPINRHKPNSVGQSDLRSNVKLGGGGGSYVTSQNTLVTDPNETTVIYDINDFVTYSAIEDFQVGGCVSVNADFPWIHVPWDGLQYPNATGIIKSISGTSITVILATSKVITINEDLFTANKEVFLSMSGKCLTTSPDYTNLTVRQSLGFAIATNKFILNIKEPEYKVTF